MSLFDDPVTRYGATEIAFPSLKAVTMAQWILESGRGAVSDVLARERIRASPPARRRTNNNPRVTPDEIRNPVPGRPLVWRTRP